MNLRVFLTAVSAAAGLLLLSGCMSAPGGIAASTVPITAKDTYTVVKRRALGTDTGVTLLGIPLGPAPSAYKALQDVKKRTGADALINVTGENKYRYFLFLVCVQEMAVTGDAIKFQLSGEELTR